MTDPIVISPDVISATLDATSAVVSLLGPTLSAIASKGGSEVVIAKVGSLKREKEASVVRAEFEPLLYELSQDRDTAVAIATRYQKELQKQTITRRNTKLTKNSS